MKPRVLPLLALVLLLSVGFWLTREESLPVAGPEGVVTGDEGRESPVLQPSTGLTPEVEISRTRAVPERPLPADDSGATRGWRLEGLVLNEEGRPIPNAEVAIFTEMYPRRGRTSKDDWQITVASHELGRTISAQDGSWCLEYEKFPTDPKPSGRDAWSLGSTGVQATASGYWSRGIVLAQELSAHGGHCRLTLEVGTTLSGKIATGDGTPAARAQVRHLAERLAMTSQEGRFRIDADPDNPTDLFITHPLGTALVEEVHPPAAGDLDLGTIVLSGSGELAGRLQLPDGSPAPFLWISAWQIEGSNGDNSSSRERRGGHQQGKALTDQSGRFRIQGLRAASFRLQCEYEDTALALQTTAAGEVGSFDSTAREEIVLILPWRVVVARLPETVPLSTASIVISAAPSSDDGLPPVPDAFQFLTRVRARPEEGARSLLFDAPGWVRLQIIDWENHSTFSIVEIKSSPWLYRTSFRTEESRATGAILVRARHADGSPMRSLGQDLYETTRGEYTNTMRSRVGNDWLLSEVPTGVWRLTLTAPKRNANDVTLPGVFEVEIRPKETATVEWTARPGGELSVLAHLGESSTSMIRCTVLAGPGRVGAALLFLPIGEQDRRIPQQYFSSELLMKVDGVMEPGRYRLRFEAAGFEPRETEVEVEPDSMAHCETLLERTG